MPPFINSIDMLGNGIRNLANPTLAQDACTKKYVDDLISASDMKGTVRAATTANISLSGTQTIDGVAVVAGDRVLVKNQTTQSANGIYVVGAGAWARASDADTWIELNAAIVPVDQGTANDNKVFLNTSNMGGTLDTTNVIFVEFGTISVYTNGAGLSLTGNQFSITAGGVTNAMIADSAITALKLADNAVMTSKILDAAVTTAKIGNLAVDATKIADNAIVTSKITDGTVTAVKLATDAVITAKIQDGAVTNTKLATDAVTAIKIQADAITTVKILNGNVTAAKLATGAVDLTTTVVTGTLPISKGGTGATTAAAAKAALGAIGRYQVNVAISTLTGGSYTIPGGTHQMGATGLQTSMTLVGIPLGNSLVTVQPDVAADATSTDITFSFSYASLVSLAGSGGTAIFVLQG